MPPHLGNPHPGNPRPAPPQPRLLVLADSLAFHGPTGPMPADDERLWPNIAAAQLGGTAHLFAGFGWTARDAWWALTGDPNIWPLLPKIDAVVLGVGSMDTLPSPLPTYLRTGLRYLRPDPLRRTARKAYLAAQPVLSRLLGGRPVALPPALSARYLGEIVGGIRALRPDLPAVAILPATHRAPSYGSVHTGHGPARAAIRKWGEQAKIPLLDLTALTRDHVFAGLGNPDGMHWGWAAHQTVGSALAATLTTLGVSAGPCRPPGPKT
ncbi:MAG TPA: diglucosylglycerate octanoyltransferase [Pseudonocardiaceae bacterium]|nr:diglucosylglycerate octanoyltransferase [Pseudonocardiaceae bacterium]